MINRNTSQETDSINNENHSKIPPDERCHLFYDKASLPPSILKWIDQNMSGFVTVWDRNGSIVYVSKSIEHFLGCKVTDLLDTQWYEKISPENAPYVKKYFDINYDISQTFNITIQDVHGKNIWTENTVTRINSESGDFFTAFTRDITDKKEAEEMMVQSEKMSVAGQLSAGIAHEIRNPLTSLKGFLQLLQAGVNRQEEYHEIMVDEIEKMEAITSELLFISKPLTNNKEVADLSGLLDDVVTLLMPQAKLKNISILWEVKDSQQIYCDRSQLKQVFINILKNAIEAMDSPGDISVDYHVRQEEICIDFSDQGPGIREEVIHKLGEPFFTTKENGTGLGLMITKQILEHHNGSLKILPNDVRGTTFRISIPTQASL